MLRVRVLGPVEAEVGGRIADLGGPRQRAVLALLLAARGDVVPVDRLIEDLWRGEPPRRASASLQAYVSNLRRLLEPDRSPRSPARVLVSAPPGYAVRLPADAVDAWRFEAELRRAADLMPGDPAAARDVLAGALRLWRGPAFAEVADEPWAGAEAARLAELRVVARERLVEATVRAGAAAEAVPAAEVLTREHPLREESWRLLALALYGSGRQADALAALRRARRAFADELGLDPGPVLVETEAAILAHRVALPAPPPAPKTPAPAPKEPEVFVGRSAELAMLAAAAADVAAGASRVVLLSGEAGTGKSALLRRFAERLDRGWLCLVGRCPEADGAPPAWAWVEALRVLASRVPPDRLAADLAPLIEDEPGGDLADSAAGRFRLHRAVAAWLRTATRTGPLALVLDDLHRGDAETLALLASVADALADAPVLVVAAYRPADGAGGPLDETLAALARRSPRRLALGGLAPAEAARMVTAVAGVPVDDHVVAALAERTGGNPFYLGESARLLASEGALVAVSEVPEGVRDVLRRRLARLPTAVVAVLRLAAAAGREADVDLLVAAAETDEDGVLDALEAGLIAGLLTEPGPRRVRFMHALVRDTLYADLSHLRRTRMHARLAAALERLRPDDLPALAHHYARSAAAETAARGLACNLAAAELAERRYAHDTAGELYDQALACLDRLPPEEVTDRAADQVDLLGRRLRTEIRAGALVAARATRDRAVAIAGACGRDDLLRAAFCAWTEPTPWEVHPYGSIDERAVALLERLARETDDAATRCRLLGSLAAELLGEDEARCAAAAREAVALARTVGDPALLGLALAVEAGGMSFELQPDARARIGAELARLGAVHDLAAYRWYGEHVATQVAAARGDFAAVRRHLAASERLAREYHLGQPQDVGLSGRAMLDHVEGRFDAAEAGYNEVAANMRSRGSLHGDFHVLALFSLRASQGRLAELVPVLHAVSERYGPLAADPLATALAAAGRRDEARRARRAAGPLRRDFFAAIWATVRAMALVALDDRDGAEELVEFCTPLRDQLAGAATASVAMRPVAHTLGELARLRGRPDEAAEHFAHAVTVADTAASPHWAAQAKAALVQVASK